MIISSFSNFLMCWDKSMRVLHRCVYENQEKWTCKKQNLKDVKDKYCIAGWWLVLVLVWFLIVGLFRSFQNYPDISWFIHIHPHLSKTIQIYSDLSKLIQIHPDLSGFIRIYPDLSRFIHIYPDFSRFFQIYSNLSRFILIFPNLCRFIQLV